MVLSTVSGILTARLLLPEGKGELTAVLLWAGIFEGVGSVGMPHAMIYFAGKGKEDVAPVFGTAMAVAMAQGTLIAGVGYLTIGHILQSYDPRIISTARLLLLWMPVFLMGTYAFRIVQGLGYFRLWNYARVAQAAIFVGSVVVLWLIDQISVRNVVYGHLAAQLALFLIATSFLVAHTRRFVVDPGLIPPLASYGGRNWLAGMLGQANAQLDQAVISTMLTPRLLGLYRIAVSATRMIGMASTGFASVILSEVARAETERDGRALIGLYLKTASVLLLAIAIPTALVMPSLLPLLFGGEYTEAVPVAQILSFAVVLFGLQRILSNGVRGQGRPELLLYAGFGAVCVTLVGLFVLLPRLGINGAAVTSLLAYGTGAVLIYVLGMYRHPVRPSESTERSSET